MEKRVSKFIENAKKSTPATADKRSTTGLQGRKRKKQQNGIQLTHWQQHHMYYSPISKD